MQLTCKFAPNMLIKRAPLISNAVMRNKYSQLKKNKNMKILTRTQLILFLFLLAGCNVINSDDQEQSRIILGESIDGVKIGDNTKTVIDKLGQPDEILMGDFAGYIYNYKNGIHAGLGVSILSEQGKGVSSIGISKPYSGKTISGIGIGSSRENVIQLLGKPTQSGEGAEKGNTIDFYYYEKNKLRFVYSINEIEFIGLSLK